MRAVILLSATVLKYGMDTPISPILGVFILILLVWDGAEAINRWQG